MAIITRPTESAGARHAPATAGPPPRRLRLWNVAAVGAIWLTSLAVVAIWVRGGGAQSMLSGPAPALIGAGRATGLVAANLLLYQVLLMARVPLFENGFGRDGITRAHRVVGFWSFWLMLGHIVLIVAGYALQAGIEPLRQAWEFVWTYPGMLPAAVGTALILAVVVTSTRRRRRRTRYESWHLLHLYAYLGVGLAVPHMLLTGGDFLASPLATAYWWGLWVTAAGCVVVFRIARPLLRSRRHRLRVGSVEPDGSRAVTVTMSGRHLDRLHARSGQFFVWRFVDGAGWAAGHPLSLSAAPTRRSLTVTARVVGDGTARIASLRRGTPVLVEGPYGVLTGEQRTGRTLLLIGAGAGVAPLVALAESETYPSGGAVLITRDHAEKEAIRAQRIRELSRMRGLRHVRLDGARARSGSTWMPAAYSAWAGPDLLRYACAEIAVADVYVCGPPTWMAGVVTDLHRAGARRSSIHTESFTS